MGAGHTGKLFHHCYIASFTRRIIKKMVRHGNGIEYLEDSEVAWALVQADELQSDTPGEVVIFRNSCLLYHRMEL